VCRFVFILEGCKYFNEFSWDEINLGAFEVLNSSSYMKVDSLGTVSISIACMSRLLVCVHEIKKKTLFLHPLDAFGA
jgi:hypothetical protein